MSVVRQPYRAASEFVRSLLEFHQLDLPWRKQLEARFIYRGVSNIEHKLVPSALRPRTMHQAKYDQLWSIASCGFDIPPEDKRERWQVRAEFEVARRFYQTADAAGLSLPTLPQVWRDIMTASAEDVVGLIAQTHLTWPQPELLSLLGLAQHHELPTRLLDWSLDPLIAAFFAARGACIELAAMKDRSSEKELVVWCLYSNILDGEKLRLVTAPTSENPNLSAQRGVFTVTKTPAPLDEIINEVDLFLGCHTLPWGEAPRLMLELHSAGYTSGRLFPGFRGAAQTVDDLALIGALKH